MGESWPLSFHKLHALTELVQQQLQKGHIVHSTSPWNPPCLLLANTVLQNSNHADTWDQWTPNLSLASLEPQELELLGSVKMDFCVKFNYSGKNQSKAWDVSHHHPVYKNANTWCNYASRTISHSTNAPLLLPPGVFLVCGDRAWPAIPLRIKGGPCSLGQLSLLVLNMSMIFQHK